MSGLAILILFAGALTIFDMSPALINQNLENSSNRSQILITPIDTNVAAASLEILNKNNVWILVPVNKNKKETKAQSKKPRFIVLPDGSKIETGI